MKRDFGKRVYRKMLDRGWSQSELAREAGINRDDVSRYVRGISLPSDQKMLALAKAFEVEASELLPNFVAHRTDFNNDEPFSLVIAPGNQTHCRISFNGVVQMNTGLKIAGLINDDKTNAPDGPTGRR